jgi:iron complex transport system substrate-binding protein
MKNKPFLPLLGLLLAASLLLNSCAPSPATPAAQPAPAEPTISEPTLPVGITLTDGLGRSITLDSPPQRIVSLAPSNTEILFAIGAGTQVVGRDEFSNYPESALDLPSVGGSWGNYNAEAIVDLKPDLVLAAEINPPELVESLEKLGLTVFLLPNPTDIEGIYQIMETSARLTGHEAETAVLVESLRERVEAVTSQTSGLTDRPLVFYELDSTEPNAPYTAGPGTFVELLIEMAGGTNTGSAMESPWAQISLEQLVVLDPEIILLGDSAYGVTPESVAARVGWESISAVVNGKVYPFNDDLASRPGPRMVDGLEEMAKLIQPEVFK